MFHTISSFKLPAAAPALACAVIVEVAAAAAVPLNNTKLKPSKACSFTAARHVDYSTQQQV